MTFNFVDITIAIFLALLTFQGLRRGLIRAIFDILAAIIAFFMGMVWYAPAAAYGGAWIKLPPNIGQIVAFIAVWIITYLVISLVGMFLHRLIKSSIFAPLNILGGGFLGLLKGALIVWLSMSLVLALPLPTTATVQLKESIAVRVMLPVLASSYTLIFNMLPKNVPNVKNYFPALQ
jgi:membrane protein required for colicin V production